MTEQIKKCKDCVNYDETKVRQCICYNNECEPNEDATHCCEFADRVYRINRAIETFEDYKENGYDIRSSNSELFDIAIRSLKAWLEVLTELENFDENEYLKDEGHRFGCNEGICYAIELINQHLAEIEGG